jgi:RNA polymerase sigma-70 factor (ECF subfamily)
VVRAVKRFGVPERHCEDVAQEVFVQVFHGLARFDPARPFKPWLKTITYRTARDHLKRESTRERPAEEPNLMDSVPDRAPNAEQDAQTAEAWKLFDEILRTLDDDRRMIFLMAKVDDLTVPEIAVSLDLPETTITSRLRSAVDHVERELRRRRLSEGQKRDGVLLAPLLLVDLPVLLERGRGGPPVTTCSDAQAWERLLRRLGEEALADAEHGPESKAPASRGPSGAWVSLSFHQLAGVVGLAMLLGAGPAALLAYNLRPKPIQIVLPSVVASAASSLAVPLAEAGPTAGTENPTKVESSANPAATPADGDATRAEVALLEAGRRALQEGKPREAIFRLERHQLLFPNSLLAQTRSDLLTRAQAKLGETRR